MRARPLLTLAVPLAVVACQPQDPQPSAPRASGPVEEARGLLQQGSLDAALEKLDAAGPGDAEALYLKGEVWAAKAKAAPPPTPPPIETPLPRGAPSPEPPEFKDEELQAIAFFEQAVAAKPDHGAAHWALADLLAPHALERLAREKELEAKRRGRRRPTPTPTPEEAPDASPERVIREFRAAAAAAPTSVEPVEALLDFCRQTERIEDGKAAFEQLVKRVPEQPEPLLRFGDYLLDEMEDPEAAIQQYSLAQVWAPDDTSIPARIADVYLDLGVAHLDKREFPWAERRFDEAAKHIRSRGSPQWQRLEAERQRLVQLSGRRR